MQPRRIDGASCCSRDKSCTPTDQNLIDGMKIYTINCALATADSNRQPASLATALYPPAPNLISDPPDDPDHIFYAIRTGIRYAGMPAWEKTLSQQDIWKVTALLSLSINFRRLCRNMENQLCVAHLGDEKKDGEGNEARQGLMPATDLCR